MGDIKVSVITNIDIEGFHMWKDAPEVVNFLRAEHRHIFNIVCYFPVTDLDRELEIFMLEWKIKDYIKNKWGEPARFGTYSCEMIALDILKEFNCSEVSVKEDNKGGAKVWQ